MEKQPLHRMDPRFNAEALALMALILSRSTMKIKRPMHQQDPETSRSSTRGKKPPLLQNQLDTEAEEYEVSTAFEYPISRIKKLRASQINSDNSGNQDHDHGQALDNVNTIISVPDPVPEINVSTKLKLFDETWITNNFALFNSSPSVPRRVENMSEANLQKQRLASNLAWMRNYSPEDLEEERKLGVPTQLKLHEDPWKIRKELTNTDIGYARRLSVSSALVKNHLLPFLKSSDVEAMESTEGLRLDVFDVNDRTSHTLVVKKCNVCYVFSDGWSSNFVYRKELKQGDEIGLYWERYYSRIHFSVLNRAASASITI